MIYQCYAFFITTSTPSDFSRELLSLLPSFSSASMLVALVLARFPFKIRRAKPGAHW